MAKHYWNKDYYFKKAHGIKIPDYNLDPPEDDDFEEEMNIVNVEENINIPDNLLFPVYSTLQPSYFHF